VKLNAICALLCVLAAMIFGCSLIKPSENIKQSALNESESTYREAFNLWSREGRIYDGLDVRLIAAATYMSPKFRKAFADEYARIYRLPEPEKNKLIADQKNAGAGYEDFIFAAYVPEKEWDDFYKKNSIWKMYLSRDDIEQVKPIEIRKLDKRDAKTGYFYSYLTPWKSIYRLRFPKLISDKGGDVQQHKTGSFKLVMTSVLGSTEMIWNF
jgi:hypothetical protein